MSRPKLWRVRFDVVVEADNADDASEFARDELAEGLIEDSGFFEHPAVRLKAGSEEYEEHVWLYE